MADPDTLPWLNAAWHKLTGHRSRIPHAILLSGQSGLGKNRLAIAFAHWLLCAAPANGGPCGQCKSCQLLAAGTHPDMKVITPLEEGKAISIDQTRELAPYLSLTPHTANQKVVILSPAEDMTTAAANSLLKQLEEPPLGSVLILVSHQPDRLPQTIRSRCSRVDIRVPLQDQALAWLGNQGIETRDAQSALAAASGAPLTARTLAAEGYADYQTQLMDGLLAVAEQGDPISCAEHWQQQGSEVALTWFHGFLLGVLKTRLDPSLVESEIAPEIRKQIQAIAARVPARATAELLEATNDARRLLSTPVDERLLLEDILIRWNRVIRTSQ